MYYKVTVQRQDKTIAFCKLACIKVLFYILAPERVTLPVTFDKESPLVPRNFSKHFAGKSDMIGVNILLFYYIL